MITLITSFDTSVLHALYAIRDYATTSIMIIVSEFGSTVVVCGLAACIALVLVLRRHRAYAAGLILSVLGSGAVALVLKELVHRARPDVVFRAYSETGYSFPSGHATLSAAFYGFLAYLAWSMIPSRPLRTAIVALLLLLVLAIGFSRLYLGVHYFSDVIGGFAVGALFVWLGILTTKRLSGRDSARG